MESFTYTNMFATKGIEYLIIISFFLIFIPFYRYLKEVEGPLKSFASLRLPRGVYFDKTHTWAFLRSAGQVQVGIDDFLAALTGSVSVQLMKHKGEFIRRGEHLATLMGDGKSLKLYSPVSGTLRQINKSVLKSHSKRTNNEFLENWLFDMEPARWDIEKSLLIFGEMAQSWMRQEKGRLKDVLAFAERKYDFSGQAVLIQEGGEIEDQILETLSPEIWQEVQSEFIDAVKD